MTVIKEGVKVSILFEVKSETGEIVLKTEEEQPLEIVVGDGDIPKSVENTLMDMKEGETKTIALEPAEAFGPKIDELIIDLPKEGFDSIVELEVGSKVSINSPEGKKLMGTVLEVKEEKISVDFNHPLAGRSLTFTVTVVSIV
jgi:FKBP-type peptidyl-prolyl cis-trans isomerase 2